MTKTNRIEQVQGVSGRPGKEPGAVVRRPDVPALTDAQAAVLSELPGRYESWPILATFDLAAAKLVRLGVGLTPRVTDLGRRALAQHRLEKSIRASFTIDTNPEGQV